MIRSFHFIPSHKGKYFKLDDLKPDYYIFDLEDAVSFGDKPQARQNLIDTYDQFKYYNNIFVRVNELDSNESPLDHKLMKSLKNYGIVFPKVDNIKTAELIVKYLNEGNDINRKTIILTESFQGLINLDKILQSLPSVFAVGLGLEDVSSSVLLRKEDAEEILSHFKLQFVTIAKSSPAICIDTISTEWNNAEQIEKECLRSKNLGFDAKFTIHPKQIDIVNNVFSIDSDLISWAIRIKEKTNLSLTTGYQMVDNELITPPKVRKAVNILTRIGAL